MELPAATLPKLALVTSGWVPGGLFLVIGILLMGLLRAHKLKVASLLSIVALMLHVITDRMIAKPVRECVDRQSELEGDANE